MKVVELFEEEPLSFDEINDTLDLMLRLLPKETEPQLVKFQSMEHRYIKGHIGQVRNKLGELRSEKRWYRLEYVNGQWALMTTTPDGLKLHSHFPDARVEKAVDTIKNLYKDWKKHQET